MLSVKNAVTTAVRGMGTISLWPKRVLQEFKCSCGDKDCDGDLIDLSPPCGHRADVVYCVSAGVLVISCRKCKAGEGVRVAGDA